MSGGRGALILASAAILGSAAPFFACTLDFDRYTSVTGASSAADAASEELPGQDARTADSMEDAPGGDARTDGPLADGGPCTPAANCLQQASSCGAACGQQYQQCVGACTGTTCMQGCTSARQSCLGRCATTCIGCEQGAGCPASSACLAASHT